MNELEFKATLKAEPKDVAKLFCAMDSTQQAEFFAHVADIAEGWELHQDTQWVYMRDDVRDLPPTQAAKAREQILRMFVWFFPLWCTKNNEYVG